MNHVPIDHAIGDFQLELYNAYANIHDAVRSLRSQLSELLEEVGRTEAAVDAEVEQLIRQVDQLVLYASEDLRHEPVDQ